MRRGGGGARTTVSAMGAVAQPSRARYFLLLVLAAAVSLVALRYERLFSAAGCSQSQLRQLGAAPAGGGEGTIDDRVALLRRELEAEKARPATPQHFRGITFTHQYWSDVSFGFKPKGAGPEFVGQRLKLFTQPPTPSTQTFYHDNETFPLLWREPASRLTAPTFNATLAAAQPSHPVMLAADVWFVEGCVRLISTPECEWPLDWTGMTFALHGAWNRSACARGHGGVWDCPSDRSVLHSDGPLPMSRVRLRHLNEWSVTAEFCSQRLQAADVLDFELHGWGVSRRYRLARVDDAQPPGEEVAMVVHFKNSAFMLPLWLQYWRALGVGRFYLYYNGRLAGFEEEDARIAAQVEADPGVTLIQWDLPFSQVNGIYMINDKVCSGHYAQIMSFNHAFYRVRGRHLYMGFFDPDEYGLYDPTLLNRAQTTGENPTLLLLARYGFPTALALDNRFGALTSPTGGKPMSLSDALTRKWYARLESEPKRAKSIIRTFRHSRDDVNVGNHVLWPFTSIETNSRTGTMLMSGSGYETFHLALSTHPHPHDASMLHVLNFKDHNSKLPFDPHVEIDKMVAADAQLPEAVKVFRAARAACTACTGARAPGCGYDC
jgi:hypothetical protein